MSVLKPDNVPVKLVLIAHIYIYSMLADCLNEKPWFLLK